MKKLKLYLETSVWNFYYADDTPEKRDKTREFFKEIKSGNYEIYISELVIAEIDEAQQEKQEKLKKLIEEYQPFKLEQSKEVADLASRYIAEKIIPAKKEEDAIHIAFAVVNDLDVVVSWNQQHIVKLKTKMLVNGINIVEGYKEIQICTAEEIIRYEE